MDIFIERIYNARGENGIGVFKPSDEALICLDCDLPAKNCKLTRCERYISLMKKLKEKENAK